MKKGEVYDIKINAQEFPLKGLGVVDDKRVIVKNAILGQTVRVRINKYRHGEGEGKLLEVLNRSDIEDAEPLCPHFGACGGCCYQTLSYTNQLHIKEMQVKQLLDSLKVEYEYEKIVASPMEWKYRNKMEFSFGDEQKGGELTLGMHKKGNFYDILTTDSCKIVNEDYNTILTEVLNYCKEKGLTYVKKMSHEGFLRHLLVRRAAKTGEILIGLVTSSQQEHSFEDLVERLRGLTLNGTIAGILHINNDSLADVVQSDNTTVLYGKEYIYEKLLGLSFKISTFSFFQTNSLGAEVLYNKVREYASDTKDNVVYDLYCGTGTIAQIVAPVAHKVIGVEIVEEAVVAAKENAKLNGLSNCEFITGDVLKTLDNIEIKPQMIILDPPREGIHPKALLKIIEYGVNQIVYVSCKPTSLVRDLEVMLKEGYKLVKACAVDMFPMTSGVETVALLEKL